MKKLILILLVLISYKSYALVGEIVVLQTPLFKKNDINSTIVGYLRKGAIVYLHPKYDHGGINEIIYDSHLENKNEINDDELLFLNTLDSTGNDAYILKAHVKIIYKDHRELQSSVFRYEHDPMDYRMLEPLPDGYPLYVMEKNRFQLLLSAGSSIASHYSYGEKITAENYGINWGFTGAYLNEIEIDPTKRTYFGIRTNLNINSNNFVLRNNLTSNENLLSFGLGPFMSYDVFKKYTYQFIIDGSITLDLLKNSVSQSVASIENQGIFWGYGITPRIGISFQKLLPIKNKRISLIIRGEMVFNIFQSLALTALQEYTYPISWPSNEIKSSFDGNFQFFVGLNFLSSHILK